MIRGLYAASMVTLLVSASVGLKWAQEGVEFLIETARKKAGRKKTARKAARKKSARKVSRKRLAQRPAQPTRTQGSAASKATTARRTSARNRARRVEAAPVDLICAALAQPARDERGRWVKGGPSLNP